MVKPETAGSLYEFVTSDPAAIVSSAWGPGKVRPSETTPGEFVIQLEDFDFVALRIQVELTMAVSLDKATGTARLESKGFQLIGPGLEGIGAHRPRDGPHAIACAAGRRGVAARSAPPRSHCFVCARPQASKVPRSLRYYFQGC